MFECVVLVDLLNSRLIIRFGSLFFFNEQVTTVVPCLSLSTDYRHTVVTGSFFGFYRLTVGLFVGYYFPLECTVTFPANCKALPLDSSLTTKRLFLSLLLSLYESWVALSYSVRSLLPPSAHHSFLFCPIVTSLFVKSCVVPSSSVRWLFPFSW